MNSPIQMKPYARAAAWLALLLASLALLAPALTSAAAGADPKVLEVGKTRYGENCSGFCHGAGGKGGRAPCLVCGKFKRGSSDEEIIKNIVEGIDNTPMGAFGDKLSKHDIAAIVVYLRDEQKKKEVEPQQTAPGFFAERAV